MSKLKELYDLVIDIECELDDAYYAIPEYDCNSDGKSNIDGARCSVYNLKDVIEKAIVEETNRKDIHGFEGTMGALENL